MELIKGAICNFLHVFIALYCHGWTDCNVNKRELSWLSQLPLTAFQWVFFFWGKSKACDVYGSSQEPYLSSAHLQCATEANFSLKMEFKQHKQQDSDCSSLNGHWCHKVTYRTFKETQKTPNHIWNLASKQNRIIKMFKCCYR